MKTRSQITTDEEPCVVSQMGSRADLDTVVKIKICTILASRTQISEFMTFYCSDWATLAINSTAVHDILDIQSR